MKKSGLSALTLVFAAPSAQADQEVLQHFTQSMSELYTTAIVCEDALSPSPISYANAISNYIQVYYPDTKSPYWVLPRVILRTTNANYCSARLHQNLMTYEVARMHFEAEYADDPIPPRLEIVKEVPARVAAPRRNTGPVAPERFRDKPTGY